MGNGKHTHTQGTFKKHFLLVMQFMMMSQLFSAAPVSCVCHSQPLDVVLGLLGDELDSLQDVGYVVDASLLDVQDLRGPVQIHHSVS